VRDDDAIIQWIAGQMTLTDDEHRYLLRVVASDTPIDVLPEKLKKLLSMAFNYLAQALNTTGNTFLFKSINQTHVASLTTAFQSCFRNVFSGALIASGKMTSGALETESIDTVREIITTSYVLAILSTATSMMFYGAAYFSLPKIVAQETAHESMPYLFFTGILGTWPILGLTVLQQISYAKNHCIAQVVSTVMSRIPSVLIGYFLMKHTSLSGSANIGIGNLIAPVASYIAMEYWMRRQSDIHEIMQLPRMQTVHTSLNDDINDAEDTTQLFAPGDAVGTRYSRIFAAVQKHMPAMFRLFLEMGFQRATEWVNVLIITFLLGALHNYYLNVMSASLQIMSIFNLCSQGVGAGATMDAEQVKKEFERALKWVGQLHELSVSSEQRPTRDLMMNRLCAHAETQYNSLKNIVIKAQLLGLSINSVVDHFLFFSRKPIVKLFSQADTTAPQETMAEWVLAITALSLIADAARLISCSSLVPWKKNLQTNVISLVTMTVIGIPVSYFSTKDRSDETILYWTFGIRTIMIFAAAMLNFGIQMHELKKDKQKLQQYSFIMPEMRDALEVDSHFRSTSPS